MQVDILTIFPRMFDAVLGESILKRAQTGGRLSITLHDLRDFTHDRHRTVDDRPFGGGPGMVMKPEPIFEAIEHLLGQEGARRRPAGCQVVLMSPQGERLTDTLAHELGRLDRLVLIAGRYEGVDARVNVLVDRVVSIGDYVLTGGELPAMVLLDAAARYIPGVLGHAEATAEESFVNGLLEYPHYTRPAVYRDLAVPEVLRSGDHPAVSRWRKLQSLARTLVARPDLLRRAPAQPK
jgi:tRNA (guanine37-N1)-methyltransferase